MVLKWDIKWLDAIYMDLTEANSGCCLTANRKINPHVLCFSIVNIKLFVAVCHCGLEKNTILTPWTLTLISHNLSSVSFQFWFIIELFSIGFNGHIFIYCHLWIYFLEQDEIYKERSTPCGNQVCKYFAQLDVGVFNSGAIKIWPCFKAVILKF